MLTLWRILLLVTVSTGAHTAHAELRDISSVKLAELLEQDTLIIDVRRDDEWRATGTVAGSHLLTFFDRRGGYDTAAWLRDLQRVADPSTPVILICDTGGRSRVIGFWMSTKLGFERIYNLRGGIQDWRSSGYPLKSYPEIVD